MAIASIAALALALLVLTSPPAAADESAPAPPVASGSASGSIPNTAEEQAATPAARTERRASKHREARRSRHEERRSGVRPSDSHAVREDKLRKHRERGEESKSIRKELHEKRKQESEANRKYREAEAANPKRNTIHDDILGSDERPAELSDTTIPEEERTTLENRYKQRLSDKHKSSPMFVRPDQPNFGLRYRVTNVATLGFSTLPHAEFSKKWKKGEGSDSEGDSPVVSFDAEDATQFIGNVTVALFGGVVPQTVDNFIGLCNHSRGFGYANSTVHRIVEDFVIQMGDFELGNGAGGHSYYAEDDDESEESLQETEAVSKAMKNKSPSASLSPSLARDRLADSEDVRPRDAKYKNSYSKSRSISAKNRYFRHENYAVPHGPGTVSMASHNRNRTGSQFYITVDERERGRHLNTRFVVFGNVVTGYKSTIGALQRMRVDHDHRPLRPVVITSCVVQRYTGNDKEDAEKISVRSRRHRMIRDDHMTEDQLMAMGRDVDEKIAKDEESLEEKNSDPLKMRTATGGHAFEDEEPESVFEGPLRHFDHRRRYNLAERKERKRRFNDLRDHHGGDHRPAHSEMDKRGMKRKERAEKMRKGLYDRRGRESGDSNKPADRAQAQ